MHYRLVKQWNWSGQRTNTKVIERLSYSVIQSSEVETRFDNSLNFLLFDMFEHQDFVIFFLMNRPDHVKTSQARCNFVERVVSAEPY